VEQAIIQTSELNHLLTFDYLFILALLPVVGIILSREENIKINKNKLYAGFFIILLLAITPSFSFNPAYAENSIRQIIKMSTTYPAGVASFDITIDPPLVSINKSFIFFTVSHTGENDASDTFRSVEILDINTVRLKGEDTATGNNAVDVIIYIIEYDALSDVSVQHLQETINLASTATEVFTIPTAINTTNSMLIARGQHMNFSETSVGDEEMERKRILTSTTWEYFVANDINTESEGTAISIVDWNQGGIFVQRAIGTLAPEAGDQTITVVPVTAIDPTRTMLLVTYANDEGTSIDEDDLMVQASLTNGGNIVFHRADAEGTVSFTYELIEFPVSFAKITHFNSTIPNTVLTLDVIVPEVRDFDKTFAISTVGSPFGYSTGAGNELAEVLGGIDRTQATFFVLNNTRVQLSRDDSTGDSDYAWQLVEFFETDQVENVQGTNTLRQIVKINGAYTGATAFQDFTISPPLLFVNKTILFMSISDASLDTADVGERMKRFGIIDTSTLRIHGTNAPTATNNPVNFTATIVEFDSTSPIFVQRDQVQYASMPNSDEFKMHMSPLNITGSHILFNGWTSSIGDTTIGDEELAKVRILDFDTWGYKVELPSNDEESVAVVNLIDWGQNTISVQRGTASLIGTTLSVSPLTDVVRDQTLLFVTHNPSNLEFADEPDDVGLLAHLDASVPPDIVFERISGVDPPLEINWELISFPSNFASIQHGRHTQAIGIHNATSTITAVSDLSRSFVIGTVGTPMGYSGGKGSLATTDSYGEIMGRMKLVDTTTVRFERGLDVGSWELGFQVLEFTGGVTFNQNIVDTITVAPDDPDFTITKEAVDIGTSIDLSTNKIITKLGSDIISSGDTVSTGIIFVVNLSDTGEALDVLAINVTKLAEETVGIGDDPSFVITKLLEDTASISDTVGVVVVFGVEILDTVTANDLVILNVTKTLSDVASTIDDLNLEPTKVFLDTTVIVDQTQSSTDTDVDEIDTVTVPDTFVIDVTKLIQDIATMQDQVVLIRAIDLALNDTVSVNDPSILFKITTAVSGTGGGGGGTPLPQFERIVGLNIETELIQIQPTDRVNSDFKISYFGSDRDLVTLTKITIEDAFFSSWLTFSPLPDSLDFVQTMDGSRTVNDPARFINLALDDFIVTAPPSSCDDVNIFDQDQGSCIDPLLYSVPLEFEFTKNGVKFHADHDLLIDARIQEVRCNIFIELPQTVCDTINFGTDNWFWFLAIFGVLYFLYLLIPRISPSFRTVRKVHRSDLESMSDRRIKRKFKRGKRR